MPTKKLTSLSLLILLGIIWGTGYSIARFAMTNGVPPLGYSFWQSIGPAIFMLLICTLRRQKLPITLEHLRYYFICGLTGIMIPNTNMYFASPHLPAGLLAVVVNTVPIIAYPLALIAGVEIFKKSRLLGVICAIAGLMCIVLPKTSLPSPTMLPWILSSLITPVSFAVCAIYIARFRPRDADSLTLATGTLLASSILLIPLVLTTDNFYMLHLPLTSPDLVIILEIILSSIGYVLFFQLIKIAGPVYYSLTDTIVSLTGLFWGYMIFHETLNIWTAPAAALIVIGLLLVSARNRTSL